MIYAIIGGCNRTFFIQSGQQIRKEVEDMNMITLKNIQKSYGTHQVLKDVNLNIHQGEIYGLISNVNPCRLQLAMVSAGAESLQPSWQNPVCCLQVLALSRVCL